MTLKAYEIRSDDPYGEGYDSVIVFAASYFHGLFLGRRAICLDYCEVTCKRLEEADKYAHLGPVIHWGGASHWVFREMGRESIDDYWECYECGLHDCGTGKGPTGDREDFEWLGLEDAFLCKDCAADVVAVPWSPFAEVAV